MSWVTSGEQEGQSVAKGGKAVSYVSPHWVPEMNRVHTSVTVISIPLSSVVLITSSYPLLE